MIARIVLGLIYTASALGKLFGAAPPPEGEQALQFMEVLMSSGIMLVVAVVELLGGVALLSGFFAPLALVMLAPITIMIFLYHTTMDPMGLPVAMLMIALTLVAAHGFRNLYLPIMQPRLPQPKQEA